MFRYLSWQYLLCDVANDWTHDIRLDALEIRGTSCPAEGHNFPTILALDRGHLVIELVILPVPAISLPNSAHVVDELHSRQILDHFVAGLGLDPESARRPMLEGERLPIHL